MKTLASRDNQHEESPSLSARFLIASSNGWIVQKYFCIAPTGSSDVYSFKMSFVVWPVK